jgi:putative FmdB family regulatory protein
MPLYEYACKQCGSFEVMQRISEDPLTQCPTCGAKVTKLISRSAFHLKGSGWYATDYAKNGSDSKTDESKPTSSETKEKDSTSTPSSTKESTTKANASTTSD